MTKLHHIPVLVWIGLFVDLLICFDLGKCIVVPKKSKALRSCTEANKLNKFHKEANQMHMNVTISAFFSNLHGHMF